LTNISKGEFQGEQVDNGIVLTDDNNFALLQVSVVPVYVIIKVCAGLPFNIEKRFNIRDSQIFRN
jgi:hypothetical protein